MLDDVYRDTEDRMKKSLTSLETNMAKIRTGRAHTSLLDHVQVSYYGNDTPLSQVANIAVEDSRTLSISPWEKTLVPAIEKAIMTAELGLNPVTAGEVIRVPVPPLTEDRRKDLVKLVKAEVETAKVALRNIRRDANQHCKDLLKDKSISEDEDRQAQDKIQKLTDKYVAAVDECLANKEKDLMAV